MKRVGVILRNEIVSKISKSYVRDSLLKKLNKYYIEIICIPIKQKLNCIYNIIDTCDGIILPGGDDINDIDLKIVNYLIKKDIPTLGICLGMQELGYSKKSSLTRLKKHNIAKHYNNTHEINIIKGTLLYKIYNKDVITVNSSHKYILKETLANISALSKENYIEAIEYPNNRFILGVQWHPERMSGKDSYRTFDYFISIL